MRNVSITYLNGQGITLAVAIHEPAGFDEGKQYPVVVIAHPGGDVKKQTAGLYARKLAEQGLLAIAFDDSYQGASTGLPRANWRTLTSTLKITALSSTT